MALKYQDIDLEYLDQPTPISVFSKKDAYPFRKCQDPLDRLTGMYINYYEIINITGARQKISNRRTYRDFQLAVEAASKKPAMTNRDRRNEITNIVAIYNLDNEDALLAELDYLSMQDPYSIWAPKKALLIDFAHKYDIPYERCRPDFSKLEAQIKELEHWVIEVEGHYEQNCTKDYTFDEIERHYNGLTEDGYISEEGARTRWYGHPINIEGGLT